MIRNKILKIGDTDLVQLVLQSLQSEIDEFTVSILKFSKFLIQNGLLGD